MTHETEWRSSVEDTSATNIYSLANKTFFYERIATQDFAWIAFLDTNWVAKGLRQTGDIRLSLQQPEARMREMVDMLIVNEQYTGYSTPDFPFEIAAVTLDQGNKGISIGAMKDYIFDRNHHTLNLEQDYALIMERTNGSCDSIIASCSADELRSTYGEAVRQVAFMHNVMSLNAQLTEERYSDKHYQKASQYVYAEGILYKNFHNEAWNAQEIRAVLEKLRHQKGLTPEQREYYGTLLAYDLDWDNFQREVYSQNSFYIDYLLFQRLKYHGQTHADLNWSNIHKRKDGKMVILDAWAGEQYNWQEALADFAMLAVDMEAHLVYRFKGASIIDVNENGNIIFSDTTLSELAKGYNLEDLTSNINNLVNNPANEVIRLFVEQYVQQYLHLTGQNSYGERAKFYLHAAYKARLGAIKSSKHFNQEFCEAYLITSERYKRKVRKEIKTTNILQAA